MIFKIVLFSSCVMLVSSNNVYPIMPPQTYSVYQNNYPNPSANQLSDITPYLQGLTVQNQSPPMDLSSSSLRQILLNELLSNQPVQGIFNQNLGGYGSNLMDYSPQSIALNPNSNYYRAPMAYDNFNKENTEENSGEVTDVNTEGKRKRNKRRKSSKRRQESEKSHNASKKNQKDEEVQSNERNSSKKSKKRSRKPKTDASDQETRTKNNENEDNKNTRKKKRKSKETEVEPIKDEAKVENPRPRRRHKKKPKQKKNIEEDVTTEQPTTPKSFQIQDTLNLANFYEGMIGENRVPRNPVDGTDYLKTISNLPESITSSFNMKDIEQFSNNPMMSSFFANYQSMLSNSMGKPEQKEIRRSKPQRKNNNNTKRNESRNRNSTRAAASKRVNTKPAAKPKVNIVAKEKSNYLTDKPRPNVNPIPRVEDSKSVNKPLEENTTKSDPGKDFRDAYHEIVDKEPIHDPGYESYKDTTYIADYYPSFLDSAANTANKREVYVKNLGDSKYYYAIDKSNPDFIKNMRFEGFRHPERVIKTEVKKKVEIVEKEIIKNSTTIANSADTNENGLQFRIPPRLEIPDFQTRKVERYNFVDDKDFAYSDKKILEESNVNQKYPKDVETVFANSKVVSYGPVYRPEEENINNSSPEETDVVVSEENKYYKDEGTTYVFARALDKSKAKYY